MKPGEPQSYSVTKKWKNQEPVKVSRDDILANYTSKEMDDLFSKNYKGPEREIYLKSLRDWAKGEAEVLARTPKASTKVEVPGRQLPVGTGKEKVSSLEARMAGRLESMSVDEAKDLGLSTYKQANNKEQIKAAVNYVKKNEEEALAVIRGEKQAPDGILDNAVVLALEEKAVAEGNAALAATVAKVGSQRSTRFGQEISVLRELDPDNPITAMKSIVVSRSKALERQLAKGDTVKKATERTRKAAEKAVAKQQMKIDDAQKLLDSILC
jgi:hypothetical protein